MLNGFRRDLPFATQTGDGYEDLHGGVYGVFPLTLSDALLSPGSRVGLGENCVRSLAADSILGRLWCRRRRRRRRRKISRE
jgi:hypothetical protein